MVQQWKKKSNQPHTHLQQQSFTRSINETQKALPASPRKKCEVIGRSAKKIQATHL